MNIPIPMTYLFDFDKVDKAGRNNFLAQFADLGVKHLVLSSPLMNIMAESRDTTAEIKREMEYFGLSFCDAHSPYSEYLNLNCPHDEERKSLAIRIKMYMNIAAYLGVNNMTFHLGNDMVFTQIPLQTHLDRAYRTIEAILPEAEKLNMTLCIENIHVRPATTDRILNVINTFDSPHLGLCFDIGHANLMEKGHLDPESVARKFWRAANSSEEPEWEDCMTGLQKMLPHIVTAHLHDNDGLLDSHTIPGRGNVNWQALLPVLLKAPRLKVLQSEVQMFRNNLSIKETVESFERVFAGLESAE